MDALKVGEKLPQIAGRPEGCYFEIDTQPILIYNYRRPTAAEIKSLEAHQRFEIRSQVRGDVLWITAKCADQQWIDAPYNPWLSAEPVLEDPGEYGYALLLIMVDADSNTIVALRLIGLNNKFSRGLRDQVAELQSKTLDRAAYMQKVSATQAAHSSKELAQMAQNYYKIN